MAKETLNNVETTVENVEEQIREGRVVTAEMAKEAGERIAKQRKEALTQELQDCIVKSDYTKRSILLSMRKTKADGESKLKYLKAYTEAHAELTEGKLSVEEFEEKIKAAKKTCNEKLRENEANLAKNKEALEKIFPNAWQWRFNSDII